MVEVRKVNELRHDKYPFWPSSAIGSFTVLDRKAGGDILSGLDELIGEVSQGKSVETKNNSNVGPLLSFKLLQKELATFLSEHELASSLVSGYGWFEFLSLYLDQIERTQIKAKKPGKQGLKHIDTITIKKSLLTLGVPCDLRV